MEPINQLQVSINELEAKIDSLVMELNLTKSMLDSEKKRNRELSDFFINVNYLIKEAVK